jgi:hypothetical protein
MPGVVGARTGKGAAVGLPSRRLPSRRSDTGQVTPLLAAGVMLTAMLLVALGPMGRAVTDRAQARTAADAAALAGAAVDRDAAEALAQANRGQLLRYEEHGDEVLVEVEVGGITAFSRARGFQATLADPPVDIAGGLATVSCPRGGSITVASSIASNLQSLLDHAARDGLGLCGWGYRDSQRQIELRRAHCGTSHYAIYEAPASSCSPPTARPGQSLHERGLAVDFENCSTRSTACFQWLNRHASSYGLYNLPSEPWHWSIDGT